MNHASKLYELDISFYAHGTIQQGRKVAAYFYKLTAPATIEQIHKLRAYYPYVQTGFGHSEYAPEQVASVLIFPSKAELIRKGTK